MRQAKLVGSISVSLCLCLSLPLCFSRSPTVCACLCLSHCFCLSLSLMISVCLSVPFLLSCPGCTSVSCLLQNQPTKWTSPACRVFSRAAHGQEVLSKTFKSKRAAGVRRAQAGHHRPLGYSRKSPQLALDSGRVEPPPSPWEGTSLSLPAAGRRRGQQLGEPAVPLPWAGLVGTWHWRARQTLRTWPRRTPG